MRKIDNCIGNYSVQKTLRFRAKPIGKTEENINKKNILVSDKIRSEQFKDAKKIIDRYHQQFINRILQKVHLQGLDVYEILYTKYDKSEEDRKEIRKMEELLRKQITDAFTKDDEYNFLFGKEIIEEILPNYLDNKKEIEIINNFFGFTTAFTGYNANRKNMYSNEEKSTSIAYRCINDNLPRFISNKCIYVKIKAFLSENVFEEINHNFNELFKVDELFEIDFFDFVLDQDGINLYNKYIGGYVTENGEKIKGLNEYINLYNQQISPKEKNKRIPKLKLLYKQILADVDKANYFSDQYSLDEEVFEDINEYFDDILSEKYTTAFESQKSIDLFGAIDKLFDNLQKYDIKGIFLKNDASIGKLSKDLSGRWMLINEKWNKDYDAVHKTKKIKDYEKYDEKRRKKFKSIGFFSIFEIEGLIEDDKDLKYSNVCEYYSIIVHETIEKIICNYDKANNLLLNGLDNDKNLCKDENSIALIKNLLDSVKELENLIKPFVINSSITICDELFYGDLFPLYDVLSDINGIYDKVRNYIAKKPYSKDKFKLYFDKPTFMKGWDINKEEANIAALLRKDNNYFVAIIDKNNSKILKDCPVYNGGDYFEKMILKQIPNVSKYLSIKQIKPQNPSDEIIRILEKKQKDNTSLTKSEIETLINYLKDDFLKNYEMIIDKNGKNYFNFIFKNAEDYDSLNDFFEDVAKQAYSVRFDKISSEFIYKLVDEGKIYLFQLYNKDFSPYSHGRKNLHTMYFLSAFDEINLDNPNIRFNGGAELFFRELSIKKEDMIIHPANKPIKTKNPLNDKKTVTFNYDIIKDKRYTENQFFFHMPITINCNAEKSSNINDDVRCMLKNDSNPYVIGIDRGERNLIYVCVINGNGEIVEQMSLNEIINEYNGVPVDYHRLLDDKEKERKEARQNWTTIENIKELKEGYISQVVHKVCQLAVKYDAVIAMEDLNSGFKRRRMKVEKQVYQKFETMLIKKMNYMVADKSLPADKNGGVLKGYQLTNNFESFNFKKIEKIKQNGFIFYIPAWLTSKIDPATGFVDLLKPKYKNVDEARKFISSFDTIKYIKDENMFAFSFDYSNFERADIDYKKKWTIYTNGDRITTFKNPYKNSEWDNETINLTDEFQKLFDKYDVEINGDNMINIICKVDKSQFYEKFFGLIRLILQMRNSIIGSSVDYLVSPVKDKNGKFYDSRDYEGNENAFLPANADANGAYNIARKVLWAIDVFKNTDDESIGRANIAIKNKQWLEYAQTNEHSNR